MTVIRQEDFIASVAGALQYISYYHPEDYITSLAKAYEREKSHAAKDAIAQILINSRMCAEGHRPICQDTGIVNAFVKIGMAVRFECGPGEEPMDLQQMVDAGVRRAYLDPDNKLRASILADPAGKRVNTKDNTPSVVSVELVKGSTVEVTVAAKGGGSEAKSKFAMLNPSDSVVEWVLKTVPTMGAGWCPPGMLGIGIGGTAEKAMLLAKTALMDPIDIQDLIARGPRNRSEELRIELYDKVNRLGIGAQGLGGLTTVLDVKVLDTPAHAANLPIAIIPNCAATRHAHIVLDGSGPVYLDPPSLDIWPKLTYDVSTATRVNLDTVTRAVGPVDPVREEVVGPAGPTTATRMDKFTRQMLAETGLLGMVGKAERGPVAIEAIREFGAVYLMAVGGAAYLVSKAIYGSRLVAFDDLGMEAIYEFDVRDMPVTVAVDSKGTSVHETGPAEWRLRIAGIPILQ
jgi:fumarate hydratase class I